MDIGLWCSGREMRRNLPIVPAEISVHPALLKQTDHFHCRRHHTRNADPAVAEKSNPMKTDSAAPHSPEPPDFSLVLGGPLYQLWRRTRLAGDALQLLHRRIVVLALLAWVPLLALVGRGRTRLGRQRQAAIPPRHRAARAPAARAAAVDPGGTGRPPADAPGGAAVPGRAA